MVSSLPAIFQKQVWISSDMDMIKGLSLMAIGATLIIGGIAAEIAWLGVCFGTIVIGLILLFVSPPILFFPWTLLGGSGFAIFYAGLELVLVDAEN